MIAPAIYGPCERRELERIEIVLYCFFDDSGKESDPTHDFVVLAGFFTNYWELFDTKWLNLLLKYDLPYIHLRDAISVGKKKGWDVQRLNGVLSEFASAIRESNLVGVGVGVHMDAWREVPKSLRNRFGDAQIFCCSRVIRRIMDRLETVGLNQEKITIVFDQDFEFARRRLRLFEELRKQYEPIRERVVQVSFADSRTFYPLQAADMLAWETRRQLVNAAGGKQSTVRWRELTAAMPSGQIEFAVGEFWTRGWFDREMPKLIGPDWRNLP
jgi:hypothetical protein